MTSSQAAFVVAITIGYIASFFTGYFWRPLRVEVREVEVSTRSTKMQVQLNYQAPGEAPMTMIIPAYWAALGVNYMVEGGRSVGVMLIDPSPETPERKD